MKKFPTRFIDENGLTHNGPIVYADSYEDARKYCNVELGENYILLSPIVIDDIDPDSETVH